MGRLSGISGAKAIRAFEGFGYVNDHQTGSHVILYHRERAPLSVPNHAELAPGLVRGLVRRSGIELEDFLRILKK